MHDQALHVNTTCIFCAQPYGCSAALCIFNASCKLALRKYNASVGLGISIEGIDRRGLGRSLMRVRGRVMQEDDRIRIWKKKIDKRVKIVAVEK